MADPVNRWLRRSDQAVCAVIIAMTIAAVVGKSWRDSRFAAHSSDLPGDHSGALVVDVNTAPWPELVLLPGIGPKLAQRIVLARERHGPFRTPEDLLRVQGIGPITLSRMRPHLYFGDAGGASQDQSIAKSSARAE